MHSRFYYLLYLLLCFYLLCPLTIYADSPTETLSTPQLLDQAVAEGRLDEGQAALYLAYALADDDKLPAAYRSDVPWHGTLPLLKLQETLPRLQSRTRQQTIQGLLQGSCSPSTNLQETEHFYIEYNTIGGGFGGGLGLDDYQQALEQAWTTEVISFGWAAPPLSAPGNRYHVRIDRLGNGLYGYVAQNDFVGDNPNTPWNDQDAYSSCMVLNRDYTGFSGTPRAAMEATIAHEFNHVLQYGYGAITGPNAPDYSFIEGGATWMEDEVFDSANDNYNFLWPDFRMCMGQYTKNPYPYWITFRGLTEGFGTGQADQGEQIMQDFWEATSQSSNNKMLTALNDALVKRGTTLAEAYHAYAIAVKFNKACGEGYTYPHCLEEGPAYVAAAGATPIHRQINEVGESFTSTLPDHYALEWTSLPTDTAHYGITFENIDSSGEFRVSLVCDTGTAFNIQPFSQVFGSGQGEWLAYQGANRCRELIAVVTNQAQSAANPSFCSQDSYRLRVPHRIWTGSADTNWHNPANWFPFGSPTQTHTVFIPGLITPATVISEDIALTSLTIAPGGTLDLTRYKLTVEQALINSGTLKQSVIYEPRVVSQTDEMPFSVLHIQNLSGTVTHYYGIELQPQTAMTNVVARPDQTALTATNLLTVSIAGHQHCPGQNSGVKRCVDIETDLSLKADLRFYFTKAELNNLNLTASNITSVGDVFYIELADVSLAELSAPIVLRASYPLYLPLIS